MDPLMRWADVVVENFSPGTMLKLGLDFAQSQRLNPHIILVSGSVYGQNGPLAQEWGVDGTGAALSGRTYLTGWPDRDPVIPGAVPYGDVIVPYAMAAAAAAALQWRHQHGCGCHIDASMYELCVQQTRAAIERTQRGERVGRLGNQDERLFHQGVYPTAGEDQWIAVTCATRADWQALRQHAGLSGTEPQAGDAQLSDWTRTQDGAGLAEHLQRAGICAGVVQDIEHLLEHDPQIAHRQALMPLRHALLGAFGHMRTPITFSDTVLAPYRAPSIGEHSTEIARELAGLTPARIQELETLGVFR